MEIYIVRPKDTVDSIAGSYGISPQSIIYVNQLAYPYPLAVGQALLLPDANPPASENDGTYRVFAGGYAYPFISRWVLEQTLPFLSDLFIFSYGFTTAGELVPPQLDDTFMITAAKNYGVAPILTLTPFGPDGRFSNYLISQIVNNETAKATINVAPEDQSGQLKNLLLRLKKLNPSGQLQQLCLKKLCLFHLLLLQSHHR